MFYSASMVIRRGMTNNGTGCILFGDLLGTRGQRMCVVRGLAVGARVLVRARGLAALLVGIEIVARV